MVTNREETCDMFTELLYRLGLADQSNYDWLWGWSHDMWGSCGLFDE